MARINNVNPYMYHLDDGYSHLVREPLDFYKETFSFPKGVELPEDHYELTTYCIAGDIGSGKTWAARYFAYLCQLIWGDDIDFFEADDIFSTIEAIKKSDKFAHYVFIDDAIKPSFDSRRSMSAVNVSGSQKFLVIRHLIDKGYLKNGYIIIALATQMYKGIEMRIRKHFAFTLFKTYDDECENIIIDEEVVEFLVMLKDKSTRCKDKRYRKFGVAVDNVGYITPVLIPSKYPRMDFTKIKTTSLYQIQMNEMIDYLVELIKPKSKNEFLKGLLYFYLDKMKEKYEFVEVKASAFTEIITRAKTLRFIRDNYVYDNEINVENCIDAVDNGELKSEQEDDSEDEEDEENQLIIEKIEQEMEEEIDKEMSLVDRIKTVFKIKKVLSIQDIVDVLDENYGTVSATLSNYSNVFYRPKNERGIYCKVGYEPTDEEIEKVKKVKKKNMKSLVWPEEE